MPRRYRPPTRRRRAKKPNLPGEPAPSPAPSDVDEAQDYEAEALLQDDEDADEARYEPAPVPVVRRHEARHVIVRDHSHVVADLQRIALLVAFILGGIIITAILR